MADNLINGARTELVKLGDIEIFSNYRQYYDPVKLQELGASMLTHGQEQEICVDVNPGLTMKMAKAPYRLVYGHRRLLAAARHTDGQMTALRSLILDRTLTDAELLRLQLVENGTREGISAKDDAEAVYKLWEMEREARPNGVLTIVEFANNVLQRNRTTVQRLISLKRCKDVMAFSEDTGLTSLKTLDTVRVAFEAWPDDMTPMLGEYVNRYLDNEDREKVTRCLMKDIKTLEESKQPKPKEKGKPPRKLNVSTDDWEEVEQDDGSKLILFRDGRGQKYEVTIA